MHEDIDAKHGQARRTPKEDAIYPKTNGQSNADIPDWPGTEGLAALLNGQHVGTQK